MKFDKIFLLLPVLFIVTCKNGNLSNDSVTSYQARPGTFHLKMHDAPVNGSINHINLEIQQIDLIQETGQVITISKQLQKFDLLSFTVSNPLELFSGDIPSGRYTQIRFVLSNNNTIDVNGITYPLQMPSSQQSGYKLNGAFDYTAGLFYSMDVHFDPNKSIQYHPGAGTYLLTPVMEITNTSLISGPFRADGLITNGTTNIISLMNMKPDGSFDIITTQDPRVVLHGIYFFNLQTKLMSLSISSATCQVCGDMVIPKDKIWVTGIPNQIQVNSWGPNLIEGNVVDIFGVKLLPVTFTKNTTMNITNYAIFTTVEVTVNYPDASFNGKIGGVQLLPIGEANMKIGIQKIASQKAVITFVINNNEFGNLLKKSFYCRPMIFDTANDLVVYPQSGGALPSDASLKIYTLEINKSAKILKSAINYK